MFKEFGDDRIQLEGPTDDRRGAHPDRYSVEAPRSKPARSWHMGDLGPSLSAVREARFGRPNAKGRAQ